MTQAEKVRENKLRRKAERHPSALAGVRAPASLRHRRAGLRGTAPGQPRATALADATVAVTGLMFCALYALTGGLRVPIGLHVAWNLAQGYLFGAAVAGGNLGGSILLSTARPGPRRG